MSEKHYPYYGGNFDRIIFDKDGSVWVPEAENAKLRELLAYTVEVADDYYHCCGVKDALDAIKKEMRELGIEAS